MKLLHRQLTQEAVQRTVTHSHTSKRPASYRRKQTTPASTSQSCPQQPYYRRRPASTSSSTSQWVDWTRHNSATATQEDDGKVLLFAGLGSYPHTPYAPTPSSLNIWDIASDALLSPDATIGYWQKDIEKFASKIQGPNGLKGWMRNWVEGRSLDELMARSDVTAAFILTSSIAILASTQERLERLTLLPEGTSHLAGHGFVGTLTALVAAGRLDLATGVRLAMMYASLPAAPPHVSFRPPKYVTTIFSARLFHSLASNPWDVHPAFQASESSDSPANRRRTLQLVLDEIHSLQREWALHEDDDYAAAGFINSSKVFGVTGTVDGVGQVADRLQQLGLANPVMDVPMPCPYHTELMAHAIPQFQDMLSRCHFRDPPSGARDGHEPIVLDPISTRPLERSAEALLPQLTKQCRWHKTLSHLYLPIAPSISSFHTVGKGARGLGIMLRGELRRRPQGAKPLHVQEYGVAPERDEAAIRRWAHG